MISMAPCLLSLFLFVCILSPYRMESWNPSKEEDLEFERSLKLLNKPAIKTINSTYGDIYDCVDFYKQPAFDHPRLTNFTIEKHTLLRYQKRAKALSKSTEGMHLPGEGCPLGTVPIKRITKEDLIREKLASKTRLLAADNNYLEYGSVRTKASSKRYASMYGTSSVYKPGCTNEQYSAARMRLKNGADCVEVGWRVDPSVYGDSQTHFYILTMADGIYCLDLHCPGFVAMNPDYVIGKVARHSSKIGGPIYRIIFIIRRNRVGDWVLSVNYKDNVIGTWPKKIFTPGGLQDFASSLEWGGEVYAKPGSRLPPMGAGVKPKDPLDTDNFAFFSDMLEGNEHGFTTGHMDLEPITDSSAYVVRNVGNTHSKVGYLMFYGGPGGRAVPPA